MDKKLVKVTWIDASDPSSEKSWYSDQDVDEFSNDVCEVVSVGWVKSETPKYLTLVADYILGEEITWGRPTKIPIGWLQKVETLSVISD